MSTTVKYKGNTLATVSNDTKTLKTAGKYMEGDVELTDVSSTIVVSETLDANGGIIKTITTTDEVNLQTKTITPTSTIQTVNPDTGYDGFSQVVVNAASGEGSAILITKDIVANGTYNASNDNADGYSSVTVNVPTGSTINNQNKSVNPTESQQSITADSGYTGLGTVTVGAISSTYVGSGITRRSSSDISKNTSTGIVSIPSGYYDTDLGYGLTIQSAKTVTPTESEQTAVAADRYTTGIVKVGAISSTYVGSGITTRSSTDLTASGATVTAPAGYYAEAASKSVATMTLPTSAASSATSGYTSKATIGRSTAAQYINIPPGYNSAGAYYVISATPNGSVTAPSSISGTTATISTGNGTLTLTKTVSVTPNVTTAGYISSGTAGNSSVSLTANVTINPTPTASGATVTIPAGYYTQQTTKAVSSGSATAPSSISGTAASVSTGTNTLTLTKTVSVTPVVSAGYVSVGTAGNASVSLTASITTKAAATYTPGTTNQTIASGTYLTGTQTILGDADLVGPNIVQGAQIFGINGQATFQKYYTGSSAPASSLGNNGDIYLQE